MPHEDVYDPKQWVDDLHIWLRQQIGLFRQHPNIHQGLVDLAEVQLNVGIATLGVSVNPIQEMLKSEVDRALKARQA